MPVSLSLPKGRFARRLIDMETVETNTEGATVHFTRYDLALLANALDDIGQRLPGPEIEARLGCFPVEVQRLREKFTHLYNAVINS